MNVTILRSWQRWCTAVPVSIQRRKSAAEKWNPAVCSACYLRCELLLCADLCWPLAVCAVHTELMLFFFFWLRFFGFPLRSLLWKGTPIALACPKRQIHIWNVEKISQCCVHVCVCGGRRATHTHSRWIYEVCNFFSEVFRQVEDSSCRVCCLPMCVCAPRRREIIRNLSIESWSHPVTGGVTTISSFPTLFCLCSLSLSTFLCWLLHRPAWPCIILIILVTVPL